MLIRWALSYFYGIVVLEKGEGKFRKGAKKMARKTEKIIKIDRLMYKIAKKNVTGISENADRKDLKQMWSDDWDFFDIAVWELESALKEAYELGKASIKEGK